MPRASIRSCHGHQLGGLKSNAGLRPWRSGGWPSLGPHTAAWETYWNIRAGHYLRLPEPSHGPAINFIGVHVGYYLPEIQKVSSQGRRRAVTHAWQPCTPAHVCLHLCLLLARWESAARMKCLLRSLQGYHRSITPTSPRGAGWWVETGKDARLRPQNLHTAMKRTAAVRLQRAAAAAGAGQRS